MFNFESWIFCQFSSNTGLTIQGLFTPQKLEYEKIKLQISILEGKKLKKTWKGGFLYWRNRSQNFRFSKCYDICFYHFCEKHPLYGENASKVGKKYSPNISPHFLDAAGSQISDSWFYFHFPLLFHLLQAQLTPFSFIWNICMQKNDGQGWNFHLKYLDVEKMRGKGPKSLMS